MRDDDERLAHRADILLKIAVGLAPFIMIALVGGIVGMWIFDIWWALIPTWLLCAVAIGLSFWSARINNRLVEKAKDGIRKYFRRRRNGGGDEGTENDRPDARKTGRSGGFEES